MGSVEIAGKQVGPGHPTFIVGEIGINHNGDIELAKEMIRAAKKAGADAVKFQKRTVDVVYSPEELARPRESKWGTTNGDQKRGLEFGADEYDVIHSFCERVGIPWFASCWDEESVDFIDRYDPPAYKIASACLTNYNLLKHTKSKGTPLILSTGMSDTVDIDLATFALGWLEGFDQMIMLHCTSTYPTAREEVNLRGIEFFRQVYENETPKDRPPRLPIGFSDHTPGLPAPVAAVALGANMIEKHFTLNRTLPGSDQAASMEPHGFKKMVEYIRAVETMMGDGNIRVYDSEIPVREKLRRVSDLPGVSEYSEEGAK
jgi:N-acetylneuraminate synthase